MYDDKSATLERLKQSISTLPKNVRDRLVLENDEARIPLTRKCSVNVGTDLLQR